MYLRGNFSFRRTPTWYRNHRKSHCPGSGRFPFSSNDTVAIQYRKKNKTMTFFLQIFDIRIFSVETKMKLLKTRAILFITFTMFLKFKTVRGALSSEFYTPWIRNIRHTMCSCVRVVRGYSRCRDMNLRSFSKCRKEKKAINICTIHFL